MEKSNRPGSLNSVADAAKAAVDAAVAGAVRIAVDAAVAGAVRIAIDAAVADAVPTAVATAVSSNSKSKFSTWCDLAAKIVGCIVGILGLLSIRVGVSSENISKCTAAINEWQTLISYYDHCAKLSQNQMTRNCTELMSTGVPFPPTCIKENKLNNDEQIKAMEKVKRFFSSTSTLSNEPSSKIAIKRIGPGQHLAGYNKVDFSKRNRLHRDCVKRRQVCLKGDWAPFCNIAHYTGCFEGRLRYSDTKIVIDPVNYPPMRDLPPLNISCDDILHHYLPEAIISIPFLNKTGKAIDVIDSKDLISKCDTDFRLCQALMSDDRVPRGSLVQDSDFFLLHSIEPISSHASVNQDRVLPNPPERGTISVLPALAILVSVLQTYAILLVIFALSYIFNDDKDKSGLMINVLTKVV